jgi:hypothetical protein
MGSGRPPDGRWLAYTSNETGRYEVYVTAFPQQGEPILISTGGGTEPKWRADGKELFYLSSARSIIAVLMHGGEPVGQLQPLFKAPVVGALVNASAAARHFDVTRDGQNFIVTSPAEGLEKATIRVLTDWRDLLPTQ